MMDDDDEDELPDVHFGEVTDQPFDWRNFEAETDPDDTLLPATPIELIELLGFDPLTIDED